MDWEKAWSSYNGTAKTPSMKMRLAFLPIPLLPFHPRKRFPVLKRHLPFSFKGEAVDPINLMHEMARPDYLLSLAKATPRARAIKP